jgi:molecular chaperone IbpA
MVDQATRVDALTNWPPYNIEKLGDDQYRITMAVAGFAQDEIELTQQESRLLVTGHKHAEARESQYLHRGLATRPFSQTFNLADHLEVTGAHLDNGLLTIELKREVPEELKPRRIEIGAAPGATTLGQDNRPRLVKEAKAA